MTARWILTAGPTRPVAYCPVCQYRFLSPEADRRYPTDASSHAISYSISVIVWTALPRPRPSAPSQAASEPPDLSWTHSDLPGERKDPSRVWTMFSRSRPSSASSLAASGGGLRRPVSFLRRGRRGQTQPKQWVLDLEADDGQPAEKIDFQLDDGESIDLAGVRGADEDEAIELRQWRENVKVVGLTRAVSGVLRVPIRGGARADQRLSLAAVVLVGLALGDARPAEHAPPAVVRLVREPVRRRGWSRTATAIGRRGQGPLRPQRLWLEAACILSD